MGHIRGLGNLRAKVSLSSCTEDVFWVPREARWSRFQVHARRPTTGTTIDNATLDYHYRTRSLRLYQTTRVYYSRATANLLNDVGFTLNIRGGVLLGLCIVASFNAAREAVPPGIRDACVSEMPYFTKTLSEYWTLAG